MGFGLLDISEYRQKYGSKPTKEKYALFLIKLAKKSAMEKLKEQTAYKRNRSYEPSYEFRVMRDYKFFVEANNPELRSL